MAFDTPAKIAIIGAGPIGLEAALYARFLGYEVVLIEQGLQVCEHVRRWGTVRMFTPFSMNSSSLGLAALKAQDDNFNAPAFDALLTGNEWIAAYLEPLASSDLLVDQLRLGSRVRSVNRVGQTKSEHVGNKQRRDTGFRLQVNTPSGDRDELSDIVIDTSGVLGQPNWLGDGGAPAGGEWNLRSQQAAQPNATQHFLHTVIPPLDTFDKTFAGKKILLAGSGYSAATAICQLESTVANTPATNVTWVTRSSTPSEVDTQPPPPITPIDDDALAERSRLTAHANQLAQEPWVQRWHNVTINQIHSAAHEAETADPKILVRTSGDPDQEFVFDHVIACVGYRPDIEIFRELQVQHCYASEGPMQLAVKLAENASADCLRQSAHGAAFLITTEPDFYILGSKSYGRNSSFLFSIGLEQIRELFALIGDRTSLNLYAQYTFA
jgi:thioredoxin reductase